MHVIFNQDLISYLYRFWDFVYTYIIIEYVQRIIFVAIEHISKLGEVSEQLKF